MVIINCFLLFFLLFSSSVSKRQEMAVSSTCLSKGKNYQEQRDESHRTTLIH